MENVQNVVKKKNVNTQYGILSIMKNTTGEYVQIVRKKYLIKKIMNIQMVYVKNVNMNAIIHIGNMVIVKHSIGENVKLVEKL